MVRNNKSNDLDDVDDEVEIEWNKTIPLIIRRRLMKRII